ncbi:MAG: hypothetical protein ACK4UJ_10065 [Leptonema sp. (in: bacteria)]
MAEIYIRMWKQVELANVTKHLIIVDDLYGMCANCKEAGLNFVKNKNCPKCGTNFLYLTTKNYKEIPKILNRIKMENLPYTLIEKEDWEKATSKSTLDSLFK